MNARNTLYTLGLSIALLLTVSVEAQAELLQSSGKLTLLRVHNVNSGFGPRSDFIDVEVVVKLNTKPGKSFGFQLRNDKNRAARQGMLDLLRDAFNNGTKVVLDYNLPSGKNNGIIIRVALSKL